jgi:hypothetical protein
MSTVDRLDIKYVCGRDVVETALMSSIMLSSLSSSSRYGSPEEGGGVTVCKDEIGVSCGIVLSPTASCPIADGGE